MCAEKLCLHRHCRKLQKHFVVASTLFTCSQRTCFKLNAVVDFYSFSSFRSRFSEVVLFFCASLTFDCIKKHNLFIRFCQRSNKTQEKKTVLERQKTKCAWRSCSCFDIVESCKNMSLPAKRKYFDIDEYGIHQIRNSTRKRYLMWSPYDIIFSRIISYVA